MQSKNDNEIKMGREKSSQRESSRNGKLAKMLEVVYNWSP